MVNRSPCCIRSMLVAIAESFFLLQQVVVISLRLVIAASQICQLLCACGFTVQTRLVFVDPGIQAGNRSLTIRNFQLIGLLLTFELQDRLKFVSDCSCRA